MHDFIDLDADGMEFPVRQLPTNATPCATCGHDAKLHIYNEGPCRPGFVCPSECDQFVPTPAPTMTDDQLLSGLWWNDPEWPDWCGPLWREYVERKHAWNDYRRGVATVLRGAMEADDAK